MATLFTHAIAASALGSAVPRPFPMRICLIGAACSMVPDLDVIGFHFDIPYAHWLGHRGLSHSLAFAAILALTVGALIGRRWLAGMARWLAIIYIFVCTASH